MIILFRVVDTKAEVIENQKFSGEAETQRAWDLANALALLIQLEKISPNFLPHPVSIASW